MSDGIRARGLVLFSALISSKWYRMLPKAKKGKESDSDGAEDSVTRNFDR